MRKRLNVACVLLASSLLPAGMADAQTALKQDGIELTSGLTATVSAELTVGSVEETVTVPGGSPMVDVHGSIAVHSSVGF